MPRKGRLGQFADLGGRGAGGRGGARQERGGGFEGGVDTLMHTVLPLFIFTNYTYQKGRLGERNLIFLVRTVGRIILSWSVGYIIISFWVSTF